MKTSFAELKLRARRTLLGKYGTAIGASLINYVLIIAIVIVMEVVLMMSAVLSIALNETWTLVFLITVTLLSYIAMLFLEMMLLPGIIRMHLNLCKGDKATVSDMFFAFKNRPGKFIGITFLIGLVIIVLMVPNILIFAATSYTGSYEFYIVFNIIYTIISWGFSLYVSLNYGLFYVILAENPDKGLLEALKESKKLLRGNRGRYFLLSLSFMGWILLTYLTVGIGFLWLMPYMLSTNLHFYLDLQPQIEVIPPQRNLDFEQGLYE